MTDTAKIELVDLKTQYRRLQPEIRRRIDVVLEHGRFIMGPEVAELEKALATRSGARHVVSLSSGTDALLAALMAIEIGAGDAVFLPSFTFTATAEVVLLLGATPVFVDVRADSFNIDPADLARKVAKVAAAGKFHARAVIAVDLFGLPADYAAIRPICREHGLFLLADAAQSFGATDGEAAVGTLGDATAVSFFPAKPFGAYGDGGALLTEDRALADCVQSIRQHGKGTEKYDIVRVGLNARLDTIQAAILLAKLDAFAGELDAREALSRRYDAGLSGAVKLPPRRAGTRSAWAQYSVLTDRRDAIAAALHERGIATAIYYPLPLHLQPAYMQHGDGEGSLPVSEGLCHRILSLPMHPYMPDEAADRVCRAVREAASREAA